MKAYLLVLREGDEGYEQLSPRDLEELMKRYFEWNAKIRDSGARIDCIRLSEAPGRLARRRPGTTGGAVEVRDIEVIKTASYAGEAGAVAGLFLIRAAGRSEAELYAAACPILEFGGSVEIREVFSLFDPVREETARDEPFVDR